MRDARHLDCRIFQGPQLKRYAASRQPYAFRDGAARIGLSAGEPPVSRGYTPSVFSIMPKLLERAGNSDKGSITGLYTVLVDGDDLNEPITDSVREYLTAHRVIRALANKNHYPAIDVLASVSRLMNARQPRAFAGGGKLRGMMSVYRESQDLINIGAYRKRKQPRNRRGNRAY